MKTLLLALLMQVSLPVALQAQTPKPTPAPDPMAETVRVLQEQVSRLERDLAESRKEDAILLEKERIVRAESRTAHSTAPLGLGEFSDDYPRYYYGPYRYRSPYLLYPTRLYYPRDYYHRYYPRYYPKTYISPLRTYRRF